MSRILQTPSNPGQAAWGESAGVSGGPEVFVYREGAITEGSIYGTWDELYEDYRAFVTDSPTAFVSIVFDDAETDGAPMTIPAIPGVDVQEFTSRTEFTSARNPMNRINVELSSGAAWRVSPDPVAFGGRAQTRIRGLSFNRLDGAPSPGSVVGELLSADGDAPFRIVLEDAAMLNQNTNGPMVLQNNAQDFSILLRNGDLLADQPLIQINETTRMDLLAELRSRVEPNTIVTELFSVPDVSSRLEPDTFLGGQDALELDDGEELNGPSASLNTRPGRSITVLAREQLAVIGAQDNPIIKQAFLFALSDNPNDNDSVTITDGTTSETYTFKAAPAAPTDVQIGVGRKATSQNLAASIVANSALWTAEYVENPQTDAVGVAIIRASQLKERYPDRAFGVDTAGVARVAGPGVGGNSLGLSYSLEGSVALPAADPGQGIAGFSAIRPVLDGFFVSVINNRTKGLYQAQNPIGGGGNGRWALVSIPEEPVVFSGSSVDPLVVERGTKLIVVTLAFGIPTGDLTIGLPDTFAPGHLLSIVRTDSVAASTLTLQPQSGTIDGAANTTVPDVGTKGGPVGLNVVFDGTNWWTVSET